MTPSSRRPSHSPTDAWENGPCPSNRSGWCLAWRSPRRVSGAGGRSGPGPGQAAEGRPAGSGRPAQDPADQPPEPIPERSSSPDAADDAGPQGVRPASTCRWSTPRSCRATRRGSGSSTSPSSRVRMITVEIPGKGRRQVHYLYYRVVNRTGKPRMFVPQFTLVTDTGKRYEDTVLPQAVKTDPGPRGSHDPPARRRQHHGDDPAEHQGRDRRRRLSASRSGKGSTPRPTASASSSAASPTAISSSRLPEDGKPIGPLQDPADRLHPPRRRTRNLNEKEIQLVDPPYEWIYW